MNFRERSGIRRFVGRLHSRAGYAAAIALLAFLALAWFLLATPGQDPGSQPAVSTGPVRAAPAQESAASGTPQDSTAPAAAPAPVAGSQGPYQPALASANTNLSFGHRAGLHTAANPIGITASAALAIDRDTGAVLYSRNENAILPIASLTKLLSAMVLLDAKLPMDSPIRITRADVDQLRHSRSRVPIGTTMSRAEALRLALMSSENRAAHALARTYPGGLQAFVQAMNRKAVQLGMTGSTFAEPTGLSNANRATAIDLARLVAAARQYRHVRAATTTRRHLARFGKRRVRYLNSNRLVRFTKWPILLQKTGYIVESGHCMALDTRIHGREVILVLLDSGSAVDSIGDARRLRRWLASHGNEAAHSAVKAVPAW